MNSSPAKLLTYTNGSDELGFSNLTWKDVRVGDLVWVEDDEIISSDLVVLASSLESG